ncbi:MAG: hydroxymethylbilane synthase [Candidatus Omnitrophica bacterium]|nr:hydroxymethylbilane synthase [Candidatus Omnitrophota bacterium]
MDKIIIGARGSLLSICQAKEVIESLRIRFPKYKFYLRKITTTGDHLKYWNRQDKGIFVKEIEEALLSKKIDIAVHSLKDLPSRLHPRLKLAAVTKRLEPYDVLIVKDKKNLHELKPNAVIGTGSFRRKAQLLRWRPDLRIETLRGNLDTRINRLRRDEFDAIVVAESGLERIGYKKLFYKILPKRIMLPAACQGAIGIEIRKKDKLTAKIVKKINDSETFICAASERSFLKEMGGGCRLPLAALEEIKKERIFLEAAIFDPKKGEMIRLKKEAPISRAIALGKQVAKEILKRGGRRILKDARKNQ